MPRTALHWWACAAFAGAAARADAAWDCADAFGHRYVVATAPGDQAGLDCVERAQPPEAIAPAAPAAAIVAADSPGALVLASPHAAPPVRADRRSALDPLIEAVAATQGVDADLLRAIVHVESRYDPNAVSAKGAIGLMQIMPDTAARFGLADPPRELFRPEANLRIGALYLRDLDARFGGAIDLVAAAYNAGENAVRRCGNAVPPFPETQRYVRDVVAAYRDLRSSHGPPGLRVLPVAR